MQVANFNRVASFRREESTTTEQNGPIVLKVAFSHAFSGSLTYRVDDSTATLGTDFDLPELKTAEQGADFDPSEVMVATSDRAREIDIVINLRDDELVEDIETIRVTLLPGEGYRLGSAQQHTVSIQDNDEAWWVVHDMDGMRFDYGMRIIRNGGSPDATVTSDGGNGLPAGTYPVNLRSADDSRFEAIVGPVTVAADRTLLGAEIDRTFTLIADPSEKGHKVDYEHILTGAATETWTSEGASHLTRGDPISGTFRMSRIGGATSEKPVKDEAKGSTRTTTSALGGPGAESECKVADMSGTSKHAVMPGKPGSQAHRNPEMARVGQPFVAARIPYPHFVAETLDRARAALYYDKAPTQEAKDLAAFRYRTLLYEKEMVDARTYILAQFDKIGGLWRCAERKRAHQAAQIVIDALRYAPWNRELRWILLDIYYDIAVADKALAQEKHVAVAKLMIKPMSEERRGELIDEEIATLEDALPLYRNALAGYMKVIQETFGVDVADFEADPALHDEPFGYLIFRQEVPQRSPLAALLRNDSEDWVLPEDAGIGDERPRLFLGYKDVTLLFELLREYLRTAEQLSKRYVMRSGPSDFDRAEELIGDTLLTTWLEGNALLAMFPEIRKQGGRIDSESGLREAVAGWRHSYSTLGQIRSTLRGDANILGFPDGLLVRPQSSIEGDPKSKYFDSYDYFSEYLNSSAGPLKKAMEYTDYARTAMKDYEDRNDRLALEFSDRTEQYDERLRQVVGVRSGVSGYNIQQQRLSIQRARKRIELNSQEIENLVDEIRIEFQRRDQESKINDRISNVINDYGEKQVTLTEEIAEIQALQLDANDTASVFGSWLLAGAGILAAPVTGGASLMLFASGAANFISAGMHAGRQGALERSKGQLQASKERYAAQQHSEINSLQDDLLDVNSKARIATMLLRMRMLAIESGEVAIGLQQEAQRLSALYLEKEDLELRKAESNKLLADRYFADPSYRLLKNASVLRSQFWFEEAQRWVFLAIRAAEYKWNRKFEHHGSGTVFTMQTLFRTRNAYELSELFSALNTWDKSISAGPRNDDGYKKFSICHDFFFDVTDIDPDTGQPKEGCEKFRRYITREDSYLAADDQENPIRGFKVLKIKFSTASVPITGGLLMPDRWNEKVKFLKVQLLGGETGDIERSVSGHLKYGGMSLIRNQKEGYRDPSNPDRWVHEITTYPARYWFYDDGQWRSKEEFGSSITVGFGSSNDPTVPESVLEINTFKEFSVAASKWTLYIAVENKDGVPLVNVSELNDIQFHIYFYWYNRQN